MTFKIETEDALIGVVGGGNMGSGIAQKYATEGYQVVVVDISEDAAQKAHARISAVLSEGVERKIFSSDMAKQILSRMTFTADKNSLKDATLIVEAIFEDKNVKQQLFRELGELCGPTTILATNTSSFYVDDVADGVRHPERVLGLHYFYHPAKNRLVEVIKGIKTSQEAFDAAWAIQERSAKNPIESQDAPGFIVNRFFVPWLNESMRLVESGLTNIATVEWAAKKAFKIGLGPFELMNVTGVPITLHAATTLEAQLGAFYRPCDMIRPIVEARENWSLEGVVDASQYQLIHDRLWGVVASIATTIVFDEKVCTLEDCDLGARVGLRWRVGPFEYMNSQGLDKAKAWIDALRETYPELPSHTSWSSDYNDGFPIQVVTHRVESDGTGWITINRPDAMNALSEAVMNQLADAFDTLHNHEQVSGIIIEGKGKAFVAGADVRYFVKKIEADQVDDIVTYATNGQHLFRRIDLSTKPVVCRLHGLSLGGGSELALACDYIVGTAKGTMGFPETGIGIYPGLGGTQRTPRRIGIGLARWMVATGQILPASEAYSIGLIDECVPLSQLDTACRRYALSGSVPSRESIANGPLDKYAPLARAFEAPLDDLLAGQFSTEDERLRGQLEKAVKKMKQKAPIALRLADKLISDTKENSLEHGLASESALMDQVFGSEDALIGMKSLGRSRPTFIGK